MSKRNQYIHFPLCCLNFSNNIIEIAEKIISYGVVEFAKILETQIELYENDINNIINFIKKNKIKGVNLENETDQFIILSCIKIGVIPFDLRATKSNQKELKSYIIEFEKRNGQDCIVRVHKDIIFEVRDGKFSELLFRVYCAVLSVIGKKAFVRITIKRISYRMQGFKDLKTANKEIAKSSKILTDRQIRTLTDKLQNQGLIDKLTYKNRLTFYSVLYRGKALDKIITRSIITKQFKKQKGNIRNKKINEAVNEAIKKYQDQELSEQKSKLKLYNL